jgi:hypothetical protein
MRRWPSSSFADVECTKLNEKEFFSKTSRLRVAVPLIPKLRD